MIETTKLERETNHAYALRVIRNNIINLELKPGSLLSEQDIATELGLSRTPVHEAFQELSQTKIIEVLPQRGNMVSLIDMKMIEEAVFIRETLETALLKQVCLEATQADISRMEENINLQEFFHSKDNWNKIMELDNEFHRMMYDITGKSLCYTTVNLVSIHYTRFRTLRLQSTDSSRLVEEHRRILDAIMAKDIEKATAEYHNHLNKRFSDAQEIRKKYPEYFKE